jgi:16S rRNA (guanine527-N7)-methyltransferase
VKNARPEAVEPSRDSVASEVAVLLRTSPELVKLGLPQAFFSRMERFAAVLSVWGQRLNLTASPRSAKEICFHIVDSLAPLWAAGDALSGPGDGFDKICLAVDLGSGAGFPGLVLAAATEAEFTLVESRRKRASFLTVAAAEMGLHSVAVRWERAQPNAAGQRFDIATARAVGESRGSLEIAAELLRPRGIAILYAGAGQAIDMAWAERAGLSRYREAPYHISRDAERIARLLIVLRKRA